MKKIIKIFSNEDMETIRSAVNDAFSHLITLTNDPSLTKEEKIQIHGSKNKYLEVLGKLGGNKNDMQSDRDLREKIRRLSSDVIIIDPSGIIYECERKTESGLSRARSNNNGHSKKSMRDPQSKRFVRSGKKHSMHSKNSKGSPKKVRKLR